MYCSYSFFSIRKSKEHDHCMNSVQIRSFFWSVFSYIRTEYGDLLGRLFTQFWYILFFVNTVIPGLLYPTIFFTLLSTNFFRPTVGKICIFCNFGVVGVVGSNLRPKNWFLSLFSLTTKSVLKIDPLRIPKQLLSRSFQKLDDPSPSSMYKKKMRKVESKKTMRLSPQVRRFREIIFLGTFTFMKLTGNSVSIVYCYY